MYIEIKTERLLLRPLSVDDISDVREYTDDEQNGRYLLFAPNTEEETMDFLNYVTAEWSKEQPLFYEFAVTLDGKVIGAVSTYPDTDGAEAELGWLFNRSFHHKGYATEAAAAVRDFTLNTLKIHRIIAHCDYRNEPSAAVMKRIGMTLEKSDGLRTYPKTMKTVREYTYSLTM